MSYTSENLNFFVDLETNFKKNVYSLYYIIRRVYPADKLKEAIEQHTKHRELSVIIRDYCDSLNKMIAGMLATLAEKQGLPSQHIRAPNDSNIALNEIATHFNLADDSEITLHWGVYMWKFLHYASICMNLAKTNQELHDLFIMVVYNLQIILPCHECRLNYESKKRPVDQVENILKLSQTDPIRSIYDLHNLVNQHTKPSVYKYTFEEFLVAFDLTIEQ